MVRFESLIRSNVIFQRKVSSVPLFYLHFCATHRSNMQKSTPILYQYLGTKVCLHSYNDTVNANAEVIIARCFRLLRGQDLKPRYFHSIRFILPFLCFSFLCPKYKCPFISGFRKVNTERLLQQWHHVFHPAAMQSLFCNKRHLLIPNRRL